MSLCCLCVAVLWKPFKLLEISKNDEEETLPHPGRWRWLEVQGFWTPAQGGLKMHQWKRLHCFQSRILQWFVLRCGTQKMHLKVKVLFLFSVTAEEEENTTLLFWVCWCRYLWQSFCLNMAQDTKKDGGDYFCYIQHEEEKKETCCPWSWRSARQGLNHPLLHLC